MVTYNEISNATLATVLTGLETNQISKERIINIFHDGSLYIAVYVTTN